VRSEKKENPEKKKKNENKNFSSLLVLKKKNQKSKWPQLKECKPIVHPPYFNQHVSAMPFKMHTQARSPVSGLSGAG